jgi:hypothetical protein
MVDKTLDRGQGTNHTYNLSRSKEIEGESR